jgi:phosphoenolpyruvate synthase/pyruvate phosphate dikinase
VHPVTEDRNQLIIEAGFGLGESIVSGQVTPDSYVVEKSPRRILDVNASTQNRGLYRAASGGNEWRDIEEPRASSQVLTGEQILELSEIILNIEKHYGFPCDIEWAYEAGKFYIVQSRPITTLSEKTDESKKKSEPDIASAKYDFVSPELRGFNPDDYNFVGLWKNDLFATCFWEDCFVPEIIKDLGLKSTGPTVINLAGGNFFYLKSEWKSMDDQVGAKIDSMDTAFFDQMIKVSDKVFADGVKSGEYLRDKKPTVENFRKFVDTAKRINYLWLLGATYFVETAEAKLQDIVVKESFPAEHVLEIIPKVITPLYYRHKDLVDLHKEIGGRAFSEVQKDKKLKAKLQEEVDKYPWVEVFNFVGAPMTPERLYEQIEHMEDTPDPKPYVPKKPLSKEFLFRAKCMHDCGYVKQAGAEYFSIFSERVLPFLNAVAKEIKVTYPEFMRLSTGEVDKALQGEISSAELKKRADFRKDKNDWMFFSNDNGGAVLCEEPSDIKKLKDVMIPKADKSAKEIKGQVGNPGKYIGPARIIMNTHDFHKMKPGDVLVSTMTTPDFVILMQKSGAIVTDIGGLLCHAAIVSREIGTPCVIGTRFATQVLKDGDIVEVDADKGVVRILK